MRKVNDNYIGFALQRKSTEIQPLQTRIDVGVLLIVDDEPANLASLKRTLFKNDITILTATNAETALVQLKSNDVDVVLSDLRMPVLSGIEFLEIVKQQYPATIRILISAHSDMRSMQDSINRAGVFKVLEKPWNNTQLSSEISHAFHIHKLQVEKNVLTDKLVAANKDLEQKNTALQVAAAHATRSSSIKSEFLANMSHEIRTPIYGVLGMLDLLKETRLDTTQFRYATTAHDSASMLLRIIDDILDFSKIEAGKLSLENINFDFHQMLDDSIALVAERAQRKNLELISNIKAGVPKSVKGDPVRIKQILTNLLSNAIKFTDEGEVECLVSIKNTTVNTVNDKLTILIDVRDTGIGIPVEVQAKLFQSFSQSDNSTTRKYGGTGLGLVICKQLSRLMGGDISVRSSSGQGATFECAIQIEKSTEIDKNFYQFLGPQKVLIIEDNLTVRNTLRDYVIVWGFDAYSVCDPQSALVELKRAADEEAPYKVVITKYQSLGDFGPKWINISKKDHLFKNVHVIMLSPISDMSSALALDSDNSEMSILTKPISLSELYNTMAKVVNRRELILSTRGERKQSIRSHFKGRALLVEDNEINQEIGKNLLEKFGLDVSVAKNGIEAVEMYETSTYDIIFMDCQMPEMNGFDATRAIRKKESELQFPHTPITALTANAMRGDREKCIDAGMDDYLAKPFDTETLHKILEQWLSEKPKEKTLTFIYNGDPNDSKESEIVNRQALQRIRELMREEFPSLVNTFHVWSTKILQQIHSAILECNTSCIPDLLHTLKGASAELGAEQLVKICSDLEVCSKKGQINLTDYVCIEQAQRRFSDELDKYTQAITG